MRLLVRILLVAAAVLIVRSLPGCGGGRADLPGRDLATVVRPDGDRVVVRRPDGRGERVLNDMGYELVSGQQVRVVENCDGAPHVAAAYAPKD